MSNAHTDTKPAFSRPATREEVDYVLTVARREQVPALYDPRALSVGRVHYVYFDVLVDDRVAVTTDDCMMRHTRITSRADARNVWRAWAGRGFIRIERAETPGPLGRTPSEARRHAAEARARLLADD